LKKTIVFITHDITEAFRVGDRLAIMREGRIIQIGRPAEIVLNPADDYVSRFTEDVPLTRVITARDLVSTSGDARPSSECVAAGTVLDELVLRLAAGVTTFTVLDEQQRPIGTLDAAAALAVLERDRKRRIRP
jgi:glycine betaine/proline transport system ATP-binding protein